MIKLCTTCAKQKIINFYKRCVFYMNENPAGKGFGT
jgi:hypothetical protein